MNKKNLNDVAYYGVFGAVAAGVSYLFVPVAFAGKPVVSLLAYIVVMAVSMFVSNKLELRAWASLTADQANNMLWRLLVRLGIYIGVPAVLIYVVAFTGVFALPGGFWTAIALTWMPLVMGAWMNYFPARRR